MGNVDYKKKYMELRSVLMNVIDQAFRAGYQQGSKDAQMDAMMQQQQAQNELMAQMGGQGGMMGDEGAAPVGGDAPMAPEEQADMFMNGAADAHEQSGTSELEQGIAELEAELGKSESNKEMVANQLAALNRSLTKLKEAQELKKSAAHIKKIKSAGKKIQGLSVGYKHNLSATHKKAVSAQQKIVTDILKKWESEQTDAASAILGVVTSEGKAE
jgi:hypothetical protein